MNQSMMRIRALESLGDRAEMQFLALRDIQSSESKKAKRPKIQPHDFISPLRSVVMRSSRT